MMDQSELYVQYSAKVYAYFFTAVKNQHVAQDLTGDVFVKVYGKLDTFDETKSSLSTWIYNITKNTLYDYYRTNHPACELDENVPVDDLDEHDSYAEELKSLGQALLRLDETARKIIVEKFYHNKTLKTIALEMKIPYFRLWTTYQKSLAKMKEFMQPDTKSTN